MLFKAQEIKRWSTYYRQGNRNHLLRPMQSLTIPALLTRVKLAFGVLVGKYDTLLWPNRNEEG